MKAEAWLAAALAALQALTLFVLSGMRSDMAVVRSQTEAQGQAVAGLIVWATAHGYVAPPSTHGG